MWPGRARQGVHYAALSILVFNLSRAKGPCLYMAWVTLSGYQLASDAPRMQMAQGVGGVEWQVQLFLLLLPRKSINLSKMSL